MALGMLLVIVAGHIDLSVGSVVGFIGALAAVMMVQCEIDPRPDRPSPACVVGGVIGAAQGYWVAYLQDPVLHRHAGRHAGLQGPDPGAARRQSVGPFPASSSASAPASFPMSSAATGLRLTPRCSSALLASRRCVYLAAAAAAPTSRKHAVGDGAASRFFVVKNALLAVLIIAFWLPAGLLQGPAERADHHGAC